MSKKRDYYTEIDKVLCEYEEHRPYHDKTMEWVADRISWCWKWRKITEEQMLKLAKRATKLFEEGY